MNTNKTTSLREEKGYPKPIIPYEDRETWALNTLADHLEKILIEFDETEQEKIRPKLGNYTTGYLGLSLGLKYG